MLRGVGHAAVGPLPSFLVDGPACATPHITSNKNIHFEMILDVGIGEKRKDTRFLI